ncbi:MAG: sigma 54-interacting transcriptional regulator [Planctomycetota bacterium]|jgi:transcriptional regulator with AAA-type ATPase domain
MAALLTTAERRFAESVVRLTYGNPFLPERIAYEREALGAEFDASEAEWNLHGDVLADHPNVSRLREGCEQLITALREKLKPGKTAPADLRLFEDLVLFALYYRCRDVFESVIESTPRSRGATGVAACFGRFKKDLQWFFGASRSEPVAVSEAAHLFAIFFQVKRAFHYIFHNIIGISHPAAKFRAEAWQSIFSHDLRRYTAVLFDRMADITTLITGPSGTGKELAARAIAMAQYVPFDPQSGKFIVGFGEALHAVNLCALSPTLIESELFGHVQGAFTGAVKARLGRFEECGPTETVFLDEIGDLDTGIQVKLLSVLQTKIFQRIGESKDRVFKGKVIAATNRDLGRMIQTGRFREDFYYRLCADVIRAPSLEERLSARRDELPDLVQFIARRLVATEADGLTEEVMTYIRKHIGLDYPWPGNVRELEQCVRNVLVRGEYIPRQAAFVSFDDRLARDIMAGSISIDELLRRYCTLAYMRAGSYEETARRLHVDRRTIKARVDRELLERLRHSD